MKNGDVLYEKNMYGVLVKIVATDATEMAKEHGYTIEEWDEPTARLFLCHPEINTILEAYPIYGNIPAVVTEDEVMEMINGIK